MPELLCLPPGRGGGPGRLGRGPDRRLRPARPAGPALGLQAAAGGPHRLYLHDLRLFPGGGRPLAPRLLGDDAPARRPALCHHHQAHPPLRRLHPARLGPGLPQRVGLLHGGKPGHGRLSPAPLPDAAHPAQAHLPRAHAGPHLHRALPCLGPDRIRPLRGRVGAPRPALPLRVGAGHPGPVHPAGGGLPFQADRRGLCQGRPDLPHPPPAAAEPGGPGRHRLRPPPRLPPRPSSCAGTTGPEPPFCPDAAVSLAKTPEF